MDTTEFVDEWSVHSGAGIGGVGAGSVGLENDASRHNTSTRGVPPGMGKEQLHLHHRRRQPDDPSDAHLGFARKVREVEDSYRERYEALRGVYEARIGSMTGQLRATYRDLETDEVLQAMVDDPASAGFVQGRMGEMVEHALEHEREQFLHRLAEQCADAKQNEHALVLARQRADGASARSEQLEAEVRRAQGLSAELRDTRQRADRAAAENSALALRLRARESEAEQLGSLAAQRQLVAMGVGPDAGMRIGELSAQVKQLSSESSNARGENRQLQLEAASASAERAEAAELLAKSEAERLELRAKYIEVGEQMEAVLQEEAADHETAVGALRGKVRQLKEQLAEEVRRQREARRAAKEAAARAAALEAEAERGAAELSTARLGAREAAMVAGQRIDGLEAALARREQQAAEREAELSRRLDAREAEAAREGEAHRAKMAEIAAAQRVEAEALAKEREQRRRDEYESAQRGKYERLEKELLARVAEQQKELAAGHEAVAVRKARAADGLDDVLSEGERVGGLLLSRAEHDAEKATMRAAFDRERRELEERKGAELSSALLGVKRGVVRLEERLAEEQAQRAKLEALVEQSGLAGHVLASGAASSKAAARSGGGSGGGSSDGSGGSETDRAQKLALVAHLEEANAAIKRLKQMLTDEKAACAAVQAQLAQQRRAASQAQGEAWRRSSRVARLGHEAALLRQALAASREAAAADLARLGAELGAGMQEVARRAAEGKAAGVAAARAAGRAEGEAAARRAVAEVEKAKAEAAAAGEKAAALEEQLRARRAADEGGAAATARVAQLEAALRECRAAARLAEERAAAAEKRVAQKLSNFRSALVALGGELPTLSQDVQTGLLSDSDEHFHTCLRHLQQQAKAHVAAQRDAGRDELAPALAEARTAASAAETKLGATRADADAAKRDFDAVTARENAAKLAHVALSSERDELAARQRAQEEELAKGKSEMAMLGELHRLEHDSQVPPPSPSFLHSAAGRVSY